MSINEIPNGFKPLFKSSPYLELLGSIYDKNTDDGLILGHASRFEPPCDGELDGCVLSVSKKVIKSKI